MGKVLNIYCDGGSRGNPGPAASAFVALDNGRLIYKESKFLRSATNNFSEYMAVLMAFEWLGKNKEADSKTKINFYLDSQLVVRQLSGIYKIKSGRLKPLALKIKKLQVDLEKEVKYFSVPRAKNKLADRLVNKIIDENL
jgi:ribonuclease HI